MKQGLSVNTILEIGRRRDGFFHEWWRGKYGKKLRKLVREGKMYVAGRNKHGIWYKTNENKPV